MYCRGMRSSCRAARELFASLRLTVSNLLEHVRFIVEQHFIPKAILVDELLGHCGVRTGINSHAVHRVRLS